MTKTEILKNLIQTSFLINGSKKAYFLGVLKYLPENIIDQLIDLLKEEKKIQIKTGKKYESKLQNLYKNSQDNLNKIVKKQLKDIEKYINHQEIDDLENIINQI